MREKDLLHFKERLLGIKREVIETSEKMKEGLKVSLQDSVDELSLYDNHPGDLGDATFEREKDLGLILFAEERLAMIEEALHSIEEGTYGKCKECGENIDSNRLEALPYTTLCQQCKSKEENLERHPRPIEEEVIHPLYGGTKPGGLGWHVKRENNAFDGEDAWQAVARFGTSNTPADADSKHAYDDVYIQAGEGVGTVEDYEAIEAYKDKDGQIYQSFISKKEDQR